MALAAEIGAVYLVITHAPDIKGGDTVVAVFHTQAEAQGLCFRHEPHLYWVRRTVWTWPEIVVTPTLPNYYGCGVGYGEEYDLARPPRDDR
jgi:hypothetical protein